MMFLSNLTYDYNFDEVYLDCGIVMIKDMKKQMKIKKLREKGSIAENKV
jgi:hypothetical protein